MTINSQRLVKQYQGNNATTNFAFAYPFFALTDVIVDLYDQTTKQMVTPAPVLNGAGTYDYTMDGVLNDAGTEYALGSNVIFNTAPAADYLVIIYSAVPQTQNLSIPDGAKFPTNAVNAAFDRVVAMIQDLYNKVLWTVTFPLSDPEPSPLPVPSVRRNSVLGFDDAGGLALLPVQSVSGTYVVRNKRTVSGVAALTANDSVVFVDTTSGAATITLPANHQDIRIKDAVGNAAANNITVIPDTGLIDGKASMPIAGNWDAMDFTFDPDTGNWAAA